MRAWLNRWRRKLAYQLLYRRIFGERSQGRALPHTRISPASCIEHEERLTLGDHVYIGPFNWIEASGGVTIEEGVQITSHVSIVTHSSHRTMRLLGRAYADAGKPGGIAAQQQERIGGIAAQQQERIGGIAGHQQERPGWIAGPVHIGAYSFIGPHVLIEANSRIGRGTLVCAGSFVRGEYPDFVVLEGRPARVVGDSRVADEAWLQRHPELRAHYDAWARPS